MKPAYLVASRLGALIIHITARKRIATFVATCLLVLQGCATSGLSVDYQSKPGFDIANYDSFEIKSLVKPRVKYVDFLDNGITKALTAKGLTLKDDADLVILYDVDVEEGRRLHDEAIPVKNMVYTRTTVQARFDATILVNVVDVETNKVVWKATSTRDLTQVEPQSFNQEKADARMQELFEDFPAK